MTSHSLPSLPETSRVVQQQPPPIDPLLLPLLVHHKLHFVLPHICCLQAWPLLPGSTHHALVELLQAEYPLYGVIVDNIPLTVQEVA